MKQDMHKHHDHNQDAPDNSAHDHSGHHKMMIRDFRKRFRVSVLITLPILLLSPTIQGLLGYTFEFRYADYLLFALSGFIYLFGGWPFLKNSVDEISKRKPGMMTLIAVATTVAFGYSTATTFVLPGDKFFWELATLIDIMLLGHWIEMRSVMGASQSLQKLSELLPAEAHLVVGDDIKDVKISELEENSSIQVQPGEKVPADGVVTEGSSYVKESVVTGESKPVKKEAGSKVIGGTINGNGSLTIKVEQTGESAYLNKVIQLVKDTRKIKSKAQNMADRMAFWLTIIALTAGIGTFSVWLALGKTAVFALERMVSVMVITCPHALGLAAPLVVAIYTSVAAKNGLLIRNRTAFENARKLDLMVFDKTGTLTHGSFEVNRYGSLQADTDKQEILRWGAAVEAKSEHAIAHGILQKAKEEDIKLPSAKNFNAITGKGVEADVEGMKIKVVGPNYLTDNNISLPDPLKENKAETSVVVLKDNEPFGFISLSDRIRKESYAAIEELKHDGMETYLVTGDNSDTAEHVSSELKMDGYFAEILPDKKLEIIEDFRQKGHFVAMTGDGINDAPALAKADVGIAVGSGTDIAAETADIILVKSNPGDLVKLIEFGKKSYNKMIQNFVWATGYNVLAIPLAAGVLYSFGFLINPAISALVMSLSTIIVALNAQLLRNAMKT